MPRPQKNTIDYFSHDADASNGKTLTILFNRFGHEGLSAWWLLLELISSTRNHVISIGNPESFEYISAKLHFSPERLREILRKMAELDAIDPILFEAGFIWCQNFVDRQEPIYKYRHQPLPIKPTLPGKETQLSGEETQLSGKISTLKKDSKDSKDSKESIYKQKYGGLQNVFLSEDEYEKLKEKFNSALPNLIENLSLGIASKGYKYKSHYATILNWARKEHQNGGNAGRNQQIPRKPIPGNEPAGAFADIH